MKVFRRREVILLLAVFALSLITFGCGGGDGDSKGAAPTNISGVWEGPFTSETGEPGRITVMMEQTGKNIAGTFSIEAGGRVWESGTFSGTYENGVLVIADPERNTVHFQGNAASAVFADGSSFTVQKVS